MARLSGVFAVRRNFKMTARGRSVVSNVATKIQKAGGAPAPPAALSSEPTTSVKRRVGVVTDKSGGHAEIESRRREGVVVRVIRNAHAARSRRQSRGDVARHLELRGTGRY